MICASFSPDGLRALTVSNNGTKIWDAVTGALVINLHGHEAAVTCASFSPTNAVVLTQSDDGTAELWDATTSAIQEVFVDVNVAVFAPDGTRVLTCLFDGLVEIWDAATFALLFSVQGHTSDINVVAFSPDGTRFLTSSDGDTKIWLSASCSLQVTLPGPMLPRRKRYTFSGAAFSPDGRLVLAHRRIWVVSLAD